ncbi:hypothetical protein F8S13_19420 [Chloroflexia bacterium SDU3-3]|nr:hypothetical protein F8S13_19420 [Chloroflexia bacterium SDU3-3]
MFTSDSEDLGHAQRKQHELLAEAQHQQLAQQLAGPTMGERATTALGRGCVSIGRWLIEQSRRRRQRSLPTQNYTSHSL